jgi:DNA-binding CsgD family transcriptional regulator
VGKTALLEYLVAAASDMQVVRASGVESEMELPFASLHQMCGPLLPHLDHLPPPQREALAVVFGLHSGTAPDPFMVGLGVLSLLCNAAEQVPLVCVIDDAQWLDDASARTLAFVARRMQADPVALVFAARQRVEELQGLAELEVTGLGSDDAHALLRSTVQFLLDEALRDRIVAETHGNPLALLELPRGLTATELAGDFGLLAGQPLSGRIEQSFLRRLEALPEESRRLLLLAASEPAGAAKLLWRATAEAGVPATAAAIAEDDGLLSIGGHVTFRHPLVRSAVYRSASPDQRRGAHLALAAVIDPDADPDRRAWHLAAAAAGPDEAVAEELERSAGRAQARGGLAAAAGFLQRSVTLSVDPGRRVNRALTAADASVRAGAFDTALGMLAAAEAGSLDGLQQARFDLLRAELAFAQSRGSDAPPLFLRAAGALEPLDPKLARETYLDAWSAALFAGRFARVGNLEEVSAAARRAPAVNDRARPFELLLDGFALLYTDGRVAATPTLRRAAAAFAGRDVAVDEVLRWGWLATIAAVVVWDYGSCVAVAIRGVQLARDCGALAVLAVALNIMAQAVALGGEYGRAAQLLSEADAVTEATGSRVLPYGKIYLAAYQGREVEVARLVERIVREATASGQGNALQFTELAQAVLANGKGRYREALGAARAAIDDMPELVTAMWALSEVIEAAARTGETAIAQDAIERLARRNDGGASDWGLGLEARSRALLADGDQAECLYREAIERLARTAVRPELARAQLLYGEWLRRENRRIDARLQLRAAHELLSAIGMSLFAERARIELLATGAKVRKRMPETRDELTPQERQIAMLARDGLSNPEIGGRMFLSPRTIEWHLRKVFSKLNINSRHELGHALPDPASELVST